jgi:CheY-like chemotaxis protein
MKILLVEDDEFKQNKVESVLRPAIHECKFLVAKSVRDAVNYMQSDLFDHIILDIALPSHTQVPGGGAGLPMPSGGIEVLLEISYQSRRDPVTILTQYPEIELDGELVNLKKARHLLSKKIEAEVVDVVHFEMDSEVWVEQLSKAVIGNA